MISMKSFALPPGGRKKFLLFGENFSVFSQIQEQERERESGNIFPSLFSVKFFSFILTLLATAMSN
jgi:hypothetical protein